MPKHGRAARRVVVRAVMNLAGVFLGRQRSAGRSVTEMIVVSADRDPRALHAGDRRRRGQIGQHVVAGLLLAKHLGVHRHREVGNGEPGHVRIAAVELLLHGLERLAGCREDRVGRFAGNAGGGDARPGNGRVEAHRHRVAGVRRTRTGDHQHRLGAALASGLRLVAQVGIARQDRSRLLVGVFGEVAKDDDDLVLDVEPGVAVVAEVLRLGHHQAVAGEHHGAARFGRVGERQRQREAGAANVFGRATRRRDRDGRSAVLRARGERERHAEVGEPRQRLGADALELVDQEVGREPLAWSSGQPAVELAGRQRLDPCLATATEPRSSFARARPWPMRGRERI